MKRKCLLALAVGAAMAMAAEGIRREAVQFGKGASKTAIQGAIQGGETVDYVVRAAAGQTIWVALKGSNGQNYFNVLPPGVEDTAMHVGDDGKDYSGMLPVEGEYRVRVYLMRPAARRNESSRYTLTVGVTGKPLLPISASKDALIPGTRFHASMTVPCVPALQTKAQKCEAFVIRRGFGGTGTVEVRGPGTPSIPRHILFIAGKPAASDALEAMTYKREGEVTVVRIGAEERYEIPDLLLIGG